jgi:hypothetical protein
MEVHALQHAHLLLVDVYVFIIYDHLLSLSVVVLFHFSLTLGHAALFVPVGVVTLGQFLCHVFYA